MINYFKFAFDSKYRASVRGYQLTKHIRNTYGGDIYTVNQYILL